MSVLSISGAAFAGKKDGPALEKVCLQPGDGYL